MARPTIHVLCGFIGAGKTSFAKQLEAETGAHRFTPDEMIVARFGASLNGAQISAANGEVKAEIAAHLARLVTDGRDAILDYGLWRRDKRDELRAELDKLPADQRWYHVACAPGVMRQRALARTAVAAAGAIMVDGPHFDERWPRFQPPGEDERMTEIRTDKLTPLTALEVEPRKTPSLYPAEFAAEVAGRVKRQLGEAFGLQNFGVNLTTLPPGAKSALLHAHSTQDEMVYVLSGTPTLVTEEGEQQMQPGQCIGFPAGGPAHQIVNRSDTDAVLLEIGDRSAGDDVTYPRDDLRAVMGVDGHWLFTRKGGTAHD